MRNEHEATENSIVPIISDQKYALNTYGVKWKNIFMLKLYKKFYKYFVYERILDMEIEIEHLH